MSPFSYPWLEESKLEPRTRTKDCTMLVGAARKGLLMTEEINLPLIGVMGGGVLTPVQAALGPSGILIG